MKTFSQFNERSLTDAEKKRKEDIVLSMKRKGDFSRYGDKAKSVMYATATKLAKK